jgi:CheY-like chemotaxis protein
MARGVDPDSVDVPGLLDFQRRRWSADARQKGLSLRVVAEADAPTRADVAVLSTCRIIGNFVSNAIRNCVTGGVELVASGASDGGLRLRVTDTGPGMSEEALARARAGDLPEDLDPETARHGLGLHVARKLAGQIGATLSLRNRASGGFEAALELPATICSRPAPGAPEAESDLAGARILLAEDNPTNQMVATQMLRALRAEVTVTSDGAEALEAFEAGDFDLVVLDIEMPRVSGLDVIREIRARKDARARVPIVALTAYAMREHQERIAKAGANGLISKPINGIEAFGRALAAHLAPRRPVPPRPRAGDAPIIDAAIYAALARAIGPELMAELIEKVVLDLSAAGAELAAARAPLDLPAIRSASHILISVAGAIGAVGLQARARTLNGLAHGAEALEEPVAACLAEIDAVLAFLAEPRRMEGGV